MDKIMFITLLLFQIFYLIFIIKMTKDAIKELRQTVERGKNKDA